MRLSSVIDALQRVLRERGDLPFTAEIAYIMPSGETDHYIGNDFVEVEVARDGEEDICALLTRTDFRK